MASELETLQSRVAELESKFSFQTETLETLNDTVTKQWKEIDSLKRKIGDLDGQVYNLESNADGTSPDQKPPHY
jgi:SlyX protein